jgi:hypothetical protein
MNFTFSFLCNLAPIVFEVLTIFVNLLSPLLVHETLVTDVTVKCMSGHIHLFLYIYIDNESMNLGS